MRCHSWRPEEARKYFCPFWNGYDSGQTAESVGYRKTTRTRKRWSEEERTMNALGKDYDTERRLFRGNGYRDLSDACTVEISIDSQLGWIPSVVSASIPHPLTLPSHPPTDLPSLLSPFFRSPFLLLFTDISAKMVSCMPLSSASYFLIFFFFSPFTFLYIYTVLPFYLPATLDSTKEGWGSLQNSRNEYQINKSVLLNFNFLCLPAESHLVF